MALGPFAEALALLGAAASLGGTWAALRARARRARAALEDSEARFRHLTALSADWFWETDADYRISWLSGGAATEALFGGAAVHGRRFWEIPGLEVSPRALVAHLERLQGVDARLPLFDFELVNRSAPGGPRVHTVLGRPRHDAAGRLLGYRGVGRDVTERRRAESALREAKERLELALEGSGAILWDYDVAGGRVHVGGSAAPALLGGTARMLPIAQVLAMIHPEDLPAVRSAALAALKGERAEFAAEFRMRAPSGEWVWLLARAKVTGRDAASGRALRMSGTHLDITARKRAEQALADAEARYRALVELAPDGVIVTCGGVIEYANPAAARLLGVASPEALLGERFESFVHPQARARYCERRDYLAAGPGKVGFEERRLRRADGGEAVAEIAAVSFLERGRLVIQTVLRDVTEARAARLALAERERRFRDVVEASGEYVWETDREWRYTYLSSRVEALFGYLRHEMLGRRAADFMPLPEARSRERWFAERLAHPAPFRGVEMRALTKAGRPLWLSLNGVPVFDAAGRLAGYRGTAADVSDRRLAEERIEYLATRDALTGLPNRRLLAERAAQALGAAARERARVALLVVDLDRFQLVNDSLGHAAGDALLRAVAERLSGTLRREDTLARAGGDEFVLLWNRPGEGAGAATVAQRILAILARPFTVEGRTLGVSASIGIAVYPEDGRDFAQLLKNAHAAMHHAKRTARGGFRFFSPELDARAAERLALENELREALARGELDLYWQPVMRAGAPGTLVGAEALARWRRPREGYVAPERFVAVAEETGLIRALGEWALARALAQIGAWRRRLAPELWFALNVSAAELAQGEAFVERLAAALAQHGVPGHCLELEVTERVLVAELERNVETLRRVGELGVRVAIDDFGTGYSSLAYLRRLPVNKLKIDRAFTREIARNADDAAIVAAIAAMARALRLDLVAEGVETEAQLERLRALGCNEWQGHLAGEPLSAVDFERLASRRAHAAG
ncbi:MAG: EAL domain-containing protein [Burkholderiales bacterium]|nr:EAL domain-containing protein [Burkholderiales bacterium]